MKLDSKRSLKPSTKNRDMLGCVTQVKFPDLQQPRLEINSGDFISFCVPMNWYASTNYLYPQLGCLSLRNVENIKVFPNGVFSFSDTQLSLYKYPNLFDQSLFLISEINYIRVMRMSFDSITIEPYITFKILLNCNIYDIYLKYSEKNYDNSYMFEEFSLRPSKMSEKLNLLFSQALNSILYKSDLV